MADERQQLLQKLRSTLNTFIKDREKLICFLHEAATELDKHHKNVKITKVVTGSTGIIGTGTGLAGLAFAIPTGGLSLALTAISGVLAVTSGIAHLGSGVVEHILDKSYMGKLNKLSQVDGKNYFRLKRYLEICVEASRNHAFNNNNISFEMGRDIFNQISTLANVGCSILRVTRVASTTTSSIRIVGAASAVLGVVTLPLQIIDLAVDGRALHTDQPSETANEFRQLAQKLRTQLENMVPIMIKLRDQHEQQLRQQQNFFNPITVTFFPTFLIIIFLIIKTIFQVGFLFFF